MLRLAWCWILLVTACQLAPEFTVADRTGDGSQGQTPPDKARSIDPLLRKRILVLPFVNRSDLQSDALVRTALLEVEQAVRNAPELLLVREAEVENPESLYSAGGEYHYRKVLEQAKKAAVSGVLLGRIEEASVYERPEDTGLLGGKESSASARIHMQLYDVATEKEVFARTASAQVHQERVHWLESRNPNSSSEQAKEAVSRALKKALDRFPQMARKLAWVGRIARVELNRYYVTGGELTGLRAGQYLRVYAPPVAVTDPSSGSTLGLAPGRFKGLLRITQTFGPDASMAVLHTGAGFREEDRVEIHNPDNT